MVRLEVTTSGLDIERHLARISRDLGDAFKEATRRATPELIVSAQHAALALNIKAVGTRKRRKTAGQHSLRAHIAGAVDARYDSRRVTIFVDKDQMPAGQEALPRLTNQRQWRHPVFGNTEVWVAQSGRAGWFQRAIRQEADRTMPPELKRALERLINDSRSRHR